MSSSPSSKPLTNDNRSTQPSTTIPTVIPTTNNNNNIPSNSTNTPLPDDDIATYLPSLHARYISLQSTSTRRIGPAMSFFTPFFQQSDILSFMRCTVCVPHLSSTLETSVKSQLSKSPRSTTGTAVHRAKVPRIRGFVARSSKTATGGTSSLFNHAQRSHPTLLAALRSLIEQQLPIQSHHKLQTSSPQHSSPNHLKRRRITSPNLTNTTTTQIQQQHHHHHAKKQLHVPYSFTVHRPHEQTNLHTSSQRRSPIVIHKPEHLLFAAITASTLIPPTLSLTSSCMQSILSNPLSLSQLHILWSTLSQTLASSLQHILSKPQSFALSFDPWTISSNNSTFRTYLALRLHFLTSHSTIDSIHIGLLPPNTSIHNAMDLLKHFHIPNHLIALIASPNIHLPFIPFKLCDHVPTPFRSICLFSTLSIAVASLFDLTLPTKSTQIDHHQDHESNHPDTDPQQEVSTIPLSTFSNETPQQSHHDSSSLHTRDSSFIYTTVSAVSTYIASLNHIETTSTRSSTFFSPFLQQPSTNVIAPELGSSSPPPSNIALGTTDLADTTTRSVVNMSDIVPEVNVNPTSLVGTEREATYTNTNVANQHNSDPSICAGTTPSSSQDRIRTTPRPWLKGQFLSLLQEWEILVEMEKQTCESPFHHTTITPKLSPHHWVVIHAMIKVLALVREHLPAQQGWFMLSDTVIGFINLVCTLCDRLAQIEVIIGQKLSTSSSVEEFGKYFKQHLHTHPECMQTTVGAEEDFEQSFHLGSEEVLVHLRNEETRRVGVHILEGLLLAKLLRKLYPLVQPFIEYIPEQAHFLIAIALDPRFSSMASLIGLHKKLNQGSRFIFDKEYQGIAERDDRVRKRVLTTLMEYDNEVVIPMMRAAISKNSPAQESGIPSKLSQDTEEGLFVETFEPSDDWKLSRQLEGELNRFRSYKKNITKTASSTEALQWWDNNAELFPNISMLYRRVICIPSSYVPVERILHSTGPKVQLTRKQLGKTAIEDIVFLHENLTYSRLSSLYPEVNLKANQQGIQELSHDLFDDDTLYDIAPELFSS